MGQKVRPTGFRIGIYEDWRSRWYANKHEFSELLVEDFKIRKFIKGKYGYAGIPRIEIEDLPLGIETFGGLMNAIIPRNTTIPVKAGEMFTTAVDNQKDMLIHVLQGGRERAKDNWTVGKFTLHFEAAAKGLPRIGVQFEIDANGILHVLARDTKTGKQRVVEMKSAVDVDDADVQKMVEESVEHAFDDLKARQWIEEKIKAGTNIFATRKSSWFSRSP